jgi:hypothetical protein
MTIGTNLKFPTWMAAYNMNCSMNCKVLLSFLKKSSIERVSVGEKN